MTITVEVKLDYHDIELLNTVLSSKPLASISALSRTIDKSKISVSKRLRKLEKKGFKFTVDIDYWSIGLKIGIAVLQGYHSIKDINTRFLHSVTRLIPNATLVSYYKPVIRGRELEQEKQGDYEDYIEADEVYGSRPDFDEYYDIATSRIILNKNDVLDRILRTINNSSNVLSEIKALEKVRNMGRSKITEMDIKIVSLLEEYGIISPNAISEKLGLKKSRVLKRLTIISRYIKSLSLKESPWGIKLPLIIVSSIKARKPSYAKSIVAVLSSHPFHKKTYLSSLTGEAVILFYANSAIAESIAWIFNELSNRGLVEYYMTWATTNTSWKEYKLVEGPRYSKYTGTWIYKDRKE